MVPCRVNPNRNATQVLRRDLHGGDRAHIPVHGLVDLLPCLAAPPYRRQTREATCRLELQTSKFQDNTKCSESDKL